MQLDNDDEEDADADAETDMDADDDDEECKRACVESVEVEVVVAVTRLASSKDDELNFL